jgi:hypothetical protein
MPVERIRLSKYKEMQEELDTSEKRAEAFENRRRWALEHLTVIAYPSPDRICPICKSRYPERHAPLCHLGRAIEILEDEL